MNRMAIVATVIVLLHLAVAVVHGGAHDRLGVGLEPWQNAYVYVVIVAAPLLSAVLYWTRLRRPGALLLGLSMLGSLSFGVYFHFVAVSPDHVSHLPEGDAQHLFVATAILLIPTEALGAAFGFWTWRKLGQGKRA
jgi:hypothetical protein